MFGFSRYRVEYGEDGEIESTVFWNENGEEVTGLEGKVEKVTLFMHNGDYEIVETELGLLAFTPVTYNVSRIAYHQGNTYDMMLPYRILFNINLDIDKIISAALKKYAKAFDSDRLDIKAVRNDGAEIEDLLDRYLKSLREGGNFMELFGNINTGTVIRLLEPYAVKMPTEQEVLNFYEGFYDMTVTIWKYR